MSETYDMIVIGAGISGLAMAFEAKQAGKAVLVLEKENRAGGCFHSEAVPHEAGAFWLEMGTHTCFNSYGRLLSILERIGLMDQMQAREKQRYKMLADDTLCSIPSRLHFFELLTHAWRLFSLKKDGKSVAEYYQALVGAENYADVFRHAFNAVLCQPADHVPADMLFRKRPRNKGVQRSYTFEKGLSDVITALESQLECRRGEDISFIEQAASGFVVETDRGRYEARQLACATPVKAAARLLAASFPDVAERLNWIDEVEIESVGVVCEKEKLPLAPLAGIIAADGDFYSAVSRDYVGHERLRGLAFHFKPGLLSDEAKLQKIAAVLGVQPSDLLYVFNKTNRLPAPDMGHHQLIAELDGLLAGTPLALVGNYFAGVAVEDCLERVETEFMRLQSL